MLFKLSGTDQQTQWPEQLFHQEQVQVLWMAYNEKEKHKQAWKCHQKDQKQKQKIKKGQIMKKKRKRLKSCIWLSEENTLIDINNIEDYPNGCLLKHPYSVRASPMQMYY